MSVPTSSLSPFISTTAAERHASRAKRNVRKTCEPSSTASTRHPHPRRTHDAPHVLHIFDPIHFSNRSDGRICDGLSGTDACKPLIPRYCSTFSALLRSSWFFSALLGSSRLSSILLGSSRLFSVLLGSSRFHTDSQIKIYTINPTQTFWSILPQSYHAPPYHEAAAVQS